MKATIFITTSFSLNVKNQDVEPNSYNRDKDDSVIYNKL